jgi:hypothetical protein
MFLLFFVCFSSAGANWLCFTAEADNSELGYVNGSGNAPDVQISFDGQSWERLDPGIAVPLPKKGDKVYFRGNNPGGFSQLSTDISEMTPLNRPCSYFQMKGLISASGSVMSLVDGEGTSTKIPNEYCFNHLFYYCRSLTTAPELPATVLTRQCYDNMFFYCENLTKAPALPAKELVLSCYSNMFAYCRKLQEAPELPATTLAPNCYSFMFAYTAITEAPALPVEEIPYGCYNSMFYHCENLTVAPELPAKELPVFCYQYMFKDCTKLTRAPELPDVTLSNVSCSEMFSGCTSLNYIKVGVMTLDNDEDAMRDWVKDVNGPGTFIFPCGSKYNKHGDSEVPNNFKIVSSPIVIFQNPDGKELWRDTTDCKQVPEYKGPEQYYGEGYVFTGWDKELEAHATPDIYYYTAQYEKKDVPASGNWLCLTAEERNSYVLCRNNGSNEPDVQYSRDGVTWEKMEPLVPVTLDEVGDKIYLRGFNPDGFSHGSDEPYNIAGTVQGKYTTFHVIGSVAASGSVMSLIDGEGTSTTIPCAGCFSYLFRSANITSAPELPATELKEACYWGMFNSSYIKEAPELPAIELADYCYTAMFDNCRELTQIPELKATTMKDHCYSRMFQSCTNILYVSELPATELADNCYEAMFRLSGLVEAPQLPCTNLAPYCYWGMFLSCENLTQAPELPASVLAEGCYGSMFAGCTNLTTAPELLSESFAKECYANMFEYCQILNYIKVNVMTLDNDVDATKDWVNGVMGPGKFIFPCGSRYDKHGSSEVPANFTIVSSPIAIFQNPDGTVLWDEMIDCGATPNYQGMNPPSAGEGSVFTGWDKPIEPLIYPDVYYFTAQYENMGDAPSPNCLCFTAEQSQASFSIQHVGGNNPNIEYTTNGGVTWIPLAEGETVILANEGDKAYIRGVNPNGFSQGPDNYSQFKTSGHIATSGSVMSLIDGEGSATEIPNDYCFVHLFDNTTITAAPTLPATSLKEGCYSYMFAGCEELREAPSLPAQKMYPSCYSYMFSGCLQIDTLPLLPSLEMAPKCYMGMFMNCKNLREMPTYRYELPANEMAESCYAYMFYGCESLVDAPELPAEKLAERCYEYMFYGCRSMYFFSQLLSFDLEKYCYASMFENCTNLQETPKIIADIMKEGCFHSMFKGCTSLGTAYLPGTELKDECYKEMFSGCVSLNYIRVDLMTLDNDFDATLNWVDGVDGEGVFVFLCGSTYDKHGYSEVPPNFVIKSSPILIFLNPDSTELWRDTTDCESVPVYRGPDPTYGEGLAFAGWDKELTVHYEPDFYYYIAVYGKEGEVAAGPWLCFSAEEAGSKVWYKNSGDNSVDLQYSYDGKVWTALGEGVELPLADVGNRVYVRGNNPTGFSHGDLSGNTHFEMSGRIAASGNVMSLIDVDCEIKDIPCAHCFDSLFAGCVALTKAPELTATNTTEYCYANMFSHTSLTEMPEWFALELSKGCYSSMFAGCENLTKIHDLWSAELKEYCYAYMFQGCTALDSAPRMLTSAIAEGCYYGMFQGCTSLEKAPVLSSDYLEKDCYAYMFYGCSSLEYIEVGVMSLDNNFDATLKWVTDVDGDGLFVFPCGSKYDKHGISEVPDHFKIRSSPIVIFLNADSSELYRDTIGCYELPVYRGPEPPTYEEGLVFRGWDRKLDYLNTPGIYYYVAQYYAPEEFVEGKWLCFTAEKEMSTIQINVFGDYPYTVDIQYSMGEGDSWHVMELGEHITLQNVGDKVYFRGVNPDGFDRNHGNLQFNMSGQIAGSGSLMSLIDGKGEATVIPCDNCFNSLFIGCEALTKAPELPATSLKDGCYSYMFYLCSNLKEPPALPATELAPNCYNAMFKGCTSLETAPILPAEKMETRCYQEMLSSCTSLVTPPVLPAKELARECYSQMFSRCDAMKEGPALPATTLAPGCYMAMFFMCENMTKAPELLSTELADSCYVAMFSSCTSLNRFQEVLPATELKTGCYTGMFAMCKSLTQAPELPATELMPQCYEMMFNLCSNLNYIKVGVMSLDNDVDATNSWVNGVNGSGIFIFPCGSKYDKHGISEVPDEFIIQSSPIVIFQNPDSTVLWRDTIGCDVVPVYRGVDPPTYGSNLVFVGWDKKLTVLPYPEVYYYTAVYTEMSASVTDVPLSSCDSFVYKGVVYRENITWSDTLLSSVGMDSIVSYHLTVHKSVVTEENLTAEGSYTWKDITFTADASWNDTLRTTFGCDSIVQYHLEIKEVAPIPATITDISLIACDSLVYEGITYRESGEWNDTLPAANGGDSILAYHLTVHKSVVTEENLTAEGSYTWKDLTFTESASWNDTLRTAFGCDSVVQYHLEIKEVTPISATVTDIPLSACDSFVFEGVTYRESREWNDTLPAANGGDSILAYHLTIHKSVVTEKPITAVDSYTWQGTTYTEDASWNDTLQTVFGCDSIVRYHLTIEKETPNLQLTVEDELYLVLPGGSETISYELTGGEGSKYEVRYNGQTISSGDVTNDSTVSLTCPSSLEPGAYEATLEMCDNEGNCAEKDFTFNVMRPDDKQKSFYVKVWNDVVICRNGGGVFQTFQWYKGREKCETASLQYFNDVALLDGEYMVFVTETSGKSYFIEPIHYDVVEATYTITAEPNVVAKGTEFTLKVSGVEPDELANARIVAYHANGVVEKILDEVEELQTMRLKPGEYVIVLTVNDGKNANCKVLVK